MPSNPEDRFGDLGAEEAGRRRREAIGEKLAERDRTHPEEPDRPAPPEVPRPGNKYAWVVGIVMLMGIGVLLFTTALPNTGEGIRGPEPGAKLRPFAAPLATGNLEGDANVCAKRPCNEQTGPVPACEVRSEEVLNLCQLRRRPLVLTFVFDRGADCHPQVDRVERIRPRFPGVNFATVYFSRKERAELRQIVRRRRWRQPVAVDPDGAIANLYGVGGCPITVFARRGGVVEETVVANLTEEQLGRKARRLTRG